MNWSHLLIEAYCVYDSEVEQNIFCTCKKEPKTVGIHCLTFDGVEGKACPLFSFHKARSTVALTNSEGDVIQFNVFETNTINEDKWREEEQKWINKKRRMLE